MIKKNYLSLNSLKFNFKLFKRKKTKNSESTNSYPLTKLYYFTAFVQFISYLALHTHTKFLSIFRDLLRTTDMH